MAITNPLDAIVKPIQTLANKGLWIRIVTGLAGVALLWWGLWVLLFSNDKVQAAAKDVVNVGVGAASKGAI